MLDINRATASVLLFLKTEDEKTMNYMKLIKLLYLADRRMLEEYNTTITGDDYVLMKYGPVLSGIYDLIKEEEFLEQLKQDRGNITERKKDVWNKWLQVENYKIKIRDNYSTNEIDTFIAANLNDENKNCCTKIKDKYQGKDQWYIVEETHKLPEWKHFAKKLETTRVVSLPIAVLAHFLEKKEEEILDIVDTQSSVF